MELVESKTWTNVDGLSQNSALSFEWSQTEQCRMEH